MGVLLACRGFSRNRSKKFWFTEWTLIYPHDHILTTMNRTVVISGCRCLNSVLWILFDWKPFVLFLCHRNAIVSKQMNAEWQSCWQAVCAITLYIMTPSGTDIELHSVVQERTDVGTAKVTSQGVRRFKSLIYIFITTFTFKIQIAISTIIWFYRCTGLKGGMCYCVTERKRVRGSQRDSNTDSWKSTFIWMQKLTT